MKTKNIIALVSLSSILLNALAAHGFYDPRQGRFLNRDPIGEDGPRFLQLNQPITSELANNTRNEPNLYAFVSNDPLSFIDPWGLWKIKRDSSKNWAVAETDGPHDNPNSLALLLKLDISEFDKWAKLVDCDHYLVPNTVGVYTSKPVINPKYPDGPLTFVAFLRRWAVNLGNQAQSKGYKIVWNVGHSSDTEFISLWQTEGIYGIVFAGHASQYGFMATPNSPNAVTPDQVSPPYKLAKVIALSCFTADPYLIGYGPGGTPRYANWQDYVSKLGTFVGFHGAVNWLNWGYVIEVE